MTEPRSLSSLLRWYRNEVGDAIPVRLHSREIDEGGAPAWHGAFRAWLVAHPATEDKEGHIVSPLRYWLHRMGTAGRSGRRARYCFVLASCDFDWHLAARIHGIYDADAAHDYTVATLSRLWGLMYSVARGVDGRPVVTLNEPRRFSPGRPKSDAQLDAENAA